MTAIRERLRGLLYPRQHHIYHWLRRYLSKWDRIELNGISIAKYECPTDDALPEWIAGWAPKSDPDYEELLVKAVKADIEVGDEVVVIGGGWSVSTVAAANAAIESGTVIVFEGAASEDAKIKDTLVVNDVKSRVNVRHAVVVRTSRFEGEIAGANLLSASSLPDCDVLVVDYDGAEFPILEDNGVRPRVLIVEHHAIPGDGVPCVEYDPDRLTALIQSLDYEVIEHRHDAYGEMDELVVTARQRDGS